MTSINRRRALSGSAALAVGVPLLAACGDDSTATDTSSTPSPSDQSSSPSEDGGSSGGSSSGGAALASTSDVPVGGCFVVSASKIVLTQPTEGDFKAFSAVCTHQGCLVESSTEGDIPCPCHGSKFDVTDGSPAAGPANGPLQKVKVVVDGDNVRLA